MKQQEPNWLRPLNMAREARWAGHVPEYVVDAHGCWVWQRYKMSNGYGQMGNKGLAHRIYYEREHGPIPEGKQLDHLCRNRACVNPAHLEPVTAATNNHRGRAAKITPAGAMLIRTLKATTTLRHIDIADMFGVSYAVVAHVLTNRRWTDGLRPERGTDEIR